MKSTCAMATATTLRKPIRMQQCQSRKMPESTRKAVSQRSETKQRHFSSDNRSLQLSRGRVCKPSCLSPIILSPLNGPVKMSPYEQGDSSLEPERATTSGGDFFLHQRRTGVCQSGGAARPNASTCPASQSAL